MNWFANFFKRKQMNITRVPVKATMSSKTCPKCKDDGGFFYYKKDYLRPDSEPFHLCENCGKKTTVEEYKIFCEMNPQIPVGEQKSV